MKVIHDMKSLRQEILRLEVSKKEQAAALKENFHDILESLKPANLIKNTMKDVFAAPDIRSGLLSTGVGILAGKWLAGDGLLSGALRKAVKWGTDRLMARNDDTGKTNMEQMSSGIRTFLNKIFKKKSQPSDDSVAAV